MLKKGRKRSKHLTVVVRQTANGELWIPLPKAAAAHLSLVPNRRIWFAQTSERLSISSKPRGPYPTGKRHSTRVRLVRLKQVVRHPFKNPTSKDFA